MSLFPSPSMVRKRIDKFTRNFIWQGNNEKRSLHLVNWDILIKSKKDGGLDIMNLNAHNHSLLMKWLWRSQESNQIPPVFDGRKKLD
ncbi:hypothetical protein H5410_047115 [Solanum commersonii]|uniref:Uncharacterized protein n=1 Tax=Solanum commersonii TaxID=4109 RepID=A0A9J5XE55_SOLCO|nr:hypothetical protein H5410_047115 [Solanum commersonii]